MGFSRCSAKSLASETHRDRRRCSTPAKVGAAVERQRNAVSHPSEAGPRPPLLAAEPAICNACSTSEVRSPARATARRAPRRPCPPSPASLPISLTQRLAGMIFCWSTCRVSAGSGARPTTPTTTSARTDGRARRGPDDAPARGMPFRYRGSSLRTAEILTFGSPADLGLLPRGRACRLGPECRGRHRSPSFPKGRCRCGPPSRPARRPRAGCGCQAAASAARASTRW